MVSTNIKILSTTTLEPQKTTSLTEEPWCGKHLSEQEVPLKNVYNYANKKDTNDKTPMCRVAELARYNKLKHEYILLDEDGPAHKKRFTVKLKLCRFCISSFFEGSSNRNINYSFSQVMVKNLKEVVHQLKRPNNQLLKLQWKNQNFLELQQKVKSNEKIQVIQRCF
jgi:hypothetical protein